MAFSKSQITGIKLHRYVLMEEIGKGEFSSVSKAKTPQGRLVAIKRISISKDKERVREIYERAVNLPQHDNLVSLHEFFFHHKDPRMYIVLDMCDTRNLDKHLTTQDVTGFQKVSFMLDIAKGLHCLHYNKVIHGDIRPQNILLFRNGDRLTCKLTDYCVNVVRVRTSQTNPIRQIIDTYQAPESVDEGIFGMAADVYSAALVYYVISAETITERQGRKMLVPATSIGDDIITITGLARKGLVRAVLAPRFSSLEILGDLICAMLQLQPERRPDINRVVVALTKVKDSMGQPQASSLMGGLLMLHLLNEMLKQ